MPLGKGLPVRAPSCLCGTGKVDWDQLSSSSAALDLLQTSSCRLHRFSSKGACEDIGHCLQTTPSVSWSAIGLGLRVPQDWGGSGSPPVTQPTDRTPNQLPCRRGVAGPRWTIFHPLEERSQVVPDTPNLIPYGKHPLPWKGSWLR